MLRAIARLAWLGMLLLLATEEPDRAIAQATKPIQLTIKGIRPSDPDPVCGTGAVAVGFEICLFILGDKNEELPPAANQVKDQTYLITLPMQDKAKLRSVTVNGITLEAKDLNKPKFEVGEFKAETKVDPKTKADQIVLTKQGGNKVPCIMIFLELSHQQPGKKTVSLEGTVNLLNPAKGQKNLLTAKDSVPVNVLAAAGVTVEIDPVTFGKEPPKGKDKDKDEITPTSPINVVKNPAAIVILKGKPSQADKDNKIDLQLGNTAVIEITSVSPANTKIEGQIDWSIENVAMFTGKPDGAKEMRALFFQNNKTSITAGKSVNVYGVKEGRIRIKAAPKQNPQCSETYEAIVVEQQNIPFRAQLLAAKDKTGKVVAATARVPEEVVLHIAIANRLLRQVGVQLVPDNVIQNPVKDGATIAKTSKGEDVPGVFVKVVDNKDLIFGADRGALLQVLPLNGYPNVIQMIYIDRFKDPFQGGEAIAWPANRLTPKNTVINTVTITYRVVIDAPPLPHTIRYFLTSALELSQPSTDVSGFAVANGAPTALIYGKTLAHELGHVLTLRHRGVKDDAAKKNTGVDFVDGSITKNLMYGKEDEPLKEDLDLGQIIMLRNSLLLPANPLFSRP